MSEKTITLPITIYNGLLTALAALKDDRRHLVKNLHDRNVDISALRTRIVAVEALEKKWSGFLKDGETNILVANVYWNCADALAAALKKG